jgi:hypothetical protein
MRRIEAELTMLLAAAAVAAARAFRSWGCLALREPRQGDDGSGQLASQKLCSGGRLAPLARLAAWATLVATISVAAGGGVKGLTVSPYGVAGFDARQLQRARQPVPLRGVPLRGKTGLRLLVADKPPFVLDVDREIVTPLRGVPSTERGTVLIVGVGGRAAVVVAAREWGRAQLYAVRSSGTPAALLGSGVEVAPSADGRSVWVKSFARRSKCTLRQLGLDGRVMRAPRAIPCAFTIAPGGSLGLVVSRTRVIDPLTGRTVYRTSSGSFNTPLGIVAVAGKKLVLDDGPGRDLTLLDSVTGTRRRLPWPSTPGGLDQPAVDPQGRFVALAFANPSWTSAEGQLLDLWLLDTQTAKLTQLPGMPAFVALKRTNMAWTQGGRLVLLAESAGKDMVAVWQPGHKHLALKTVRLPDRSESGSDSFALLTPRE